MALQFSALNDCNSPDEVTTQLQRLPQDLNESYQQFFAKLSPQHYNIVLNIMQWLAFSKETLSIDQICEAAAIVKSAEDQEPEFWPGRKWTRLSLQRICADLVIITEGNKCLPYSKIISDQDHRRSKIGTFYCKRISYWSTGQIYQRRC